MSLIHLSEYFLKAPNHFRQLFMPGAAILSRKPWFLRSDFVFTKSDDNLTRYMSPRVYPIQEALVFVFPHILADDKGFCNEAEFWRKTWHGHSLAWMHPQIRPQDNINPARMPDKMCLEVLSLLDGAHYNALRSVLTYGTLTRQFDNDEAITKFRFQRPEEDSVPDTSHLLLRECMLTVDDILAESVRRTRSHPVPLTPPTEGSLSLDTLGGWHRVEDHCGINGLILDSRDQGLWTSLVVPCLLYTSPSPRDRTRSRMPSSA